MKNLKFIFIITIIVLICGCENQQSLIIDKNLVSAIRTHIDYSTTKAPPVHELERHRYSIKAPPIFQKNTGCFKCCVLHKAVRWVC